MDVRVIVLNWNLPEDTVACVRSLLAAGLAAQQILIVDNGSVDDSRHIFKNDLPTVPVLPLPENLGFAGGNNRGIVQALNEGAEWVLLLNNDTVVAADFFTKIAHGLAQTTARLAAPQILYADEAVVWSMGDVEIGKTLLTRPLYKNQRPPENLPLYISVDFLTACALFVHRSVFETVGLLDETFFMYAEDADFCQRARLAGFELVCIPAARMWHKVSRSSDGGRAQQRTWQIQNQARFYRRYATIWQKMLLIPFTLFRSGRLALRGHAKATLRGWWRGWTG